MKALRATRSVFVGLLLALAGVAAQAGPTASAQREITQLIEALGQSGCEFQRNGTWYPAGEAQAHLRRKYEWLLKRDMVASAEQFIERAGTESSVSGKPYAVRCRGQGAVPSAKWLGTRLSTIRHATP
jgi:hypothetical protein